MNLPTINREGQFSHRNRTNLISEHKLSDLRVGTNHKGQRSVKN